MKLVNITAVKLFLKQTVGSTEVGVLSCRWNGLWVFNNTYERSVKAWLLSHTHRAIWASLLEICTVCPWGNERFKWQNKCTVLRFKIYTELLHHSHLFFLWEAAEPRSDQFISEPLWGIVLKGFLSLCVFQTSAIFPCRIFCCHLYILENITVRKYDNKAESKERYRWGDNRRERK